MNIVQTESVSGFRSNYDAALKNLVKGPVFLLQRSSLAAILVSPQEWNALIERLEYLEDLAEVYKGKWLLATGQETMTRLTEEEMAAWAEESDAVLA